jgi:hypothetical protein
VACVSLRVAIVLGRKQSSNLTNPLSGNRKRHVGERAEVRLTPACATMASIGKAQAPLLASNNAQNGELGERERGTDYMAKTPKLNPFGHGPPDGWFSFGRFRENGSARPAD